MMTASDRMRSRVLGPKVRNGTATDAETVEFDGLEAKWATAYRDASPSTPVRTVFDLPVAASMWAADARRVERDES